MFCKYYIASKSNICEILKYKLQTNKFPLFTFKAFYKITFL